MSAMELFWFTTGLMLALAVVGFALVGIAGFIAALRDRTGERNRLEREGWLAEQQIAEIGRRAQEAIVAEALRRMREGRR